MNEGKTVVVFGATGGIGAYMVDHLKKQSYNVVAVGKRLFDNDYFKTIGVKYCSRDITEKINIPEIHTAFAVINLAGMLPARMEGYCPQKYIDTVITGTMNTLDFAINKGAKKYIYAHSISDVTYLTGSEKPIPNYTKIKFPKNDDHSIYAICKRSAVNIIQHYHFKYGLQTLIFRLPNVYLYHPDPHYFVDGISVWQPYRKLIDMAIKGEPIKLTQNPETIKDIFYVEDLCQMFEKGLQLNYKSGLYNAGSGIKTKLIDQIKAICSIFKQKAESEIYTTPSIINLPPKHLILDISETIKDLNYNTEYDNVKTWRDIKKEMELKRFKKLWE